MIYTPTEAEVGQRLDAVVARAAELSRSQAAKLIESGEVRLNGKASGKSATISGGDTVEINLPEPTEYEVEAEDIPLDVVYEDADIIVINKPSGMVVHPAPGNYSGTLVNALLHHCRGSLSGIGGVMRPGIVHRIDKDTSGLLVVAKCDAAHARLSEELGYHGIEREYHAIVRGGFREERGTVNLPIGRHPQDRKKMAVITSPDKTAREAVTHYELIRTYGVTHGGISHLRLRLETGRTHQIRVHMSHLGHALLGDEVYGPKTKTAFEKKHPALFSGQMLHAKRLSLTHPRTGERMTFECPLPENFLAALELLDREAER